MYLGRIVETGTAARVCSNPAHPYTAALIASVPEADPRRTRRAAALPGEPPSPTDPPPGCPFHPRCPLTTDLCRQAQPALERKAYQPRGGAVACHHTVATSQVVGHKL
jgi:oligopeptide/dipeptide ABC transporter ATP-binding protein